MKVITRSAEKDYMAESGEYGPALAGWLDEELFL